MLVTFILTMTNIATFFILHISKHSHGVNPSQQVMGLDCADRRPVLTDRSALHKGNSTKVLHSHGVATVT